MSCFLSQIFDIVGFMNPKSFGYPCQISKIIISCQFIFLYFSDLKFRIFLSGSNLIFRNRERWEYSIYLLVFDFYCDFLYSIYIDKKKKLNNLIIFFLLYIKCHLLYINFHLIEKKNFFQNFDIIHHEASRRLVSSNFLFLSLQCIIICCEK